MMISPQHKIEDKEDDLSVGMAEHLLGHFLT
jgi:hypothetical protein